MKLVYSEYINALEKVWPSQQQCIVISLRKVPFIYTAAGVGKQDEHATGIQRNAFHSTHMSIFSHTHAGSMLPFSAIGISILGQAFVTI